MSKKPDRSRAFLRIAVESTTKACRLREDDVTNRAQLYVDSLHLCGTAVDEQLNAGDVAGIV